MVECNNTCVRKKQISQKHSNDIYDMHKRKQPVLFTGCDSLVCTQPWCKCDIAVISDVRLFYKNKQVILKKH